MAKFHINPVTGKPGRCSAIKGCPFGGAENHYGSVEEAYAHYETAMASMTMPEPSEKQARKEELFSAAEIDHLREQVSPKPLPAGVKEVQTFLAGLDGEYQRLVAAKKAGEEFEDSKLGKALAPDAIITILDPDDPQDSPAFDGKQEELAQMLAPGQYKGTFYNEETEEPEEAIVVVHPSGQAQAWATFKPVWDSFDFDEDFKVRNKAKEKVQFAMEDAVANLYDVEASDRFVKMHYDQAADRLSAIYDLTDWSTPDRAKEGLIEFSDLADEYSAKQYEAEQKGRTALADTYKDIQAHLWRTKLSLVKLT